MYNVKLTGFRTWGAAMLMLAACASSAKEVGKLPSFPDFNPEFSLDSTRGDRVGPQDFKGKIVAVSFGFSSCSDVCPMVLNNVTRAVKALSAEDQTQVLFVSFDSERDDMEHLRSFIQPFRGGIIAAGGTESEIRTVLLKYAVTTEKRTVDLPIKYLYSHTDHVYLLDRDGVLRGTFGAKEATGNQFKTALQSLLREER